MSVADHLVIVHSPDTAALGRIYNLTATPAFTNLARFERRGDGWWVFDNGRASTYLNQKPIQGACLRPGDFLQIGDTMYKAYDGLPEMIVETQFTATATDGLTKLLNKRTILEQLAQGLARGPLALVMFSIDHMKRINDALGHEVGDSVIQAVAAQLRSHVRDGEHLGRWSGDTFAWIVPVDHAGLAERVAAIRASVASARLPAPVTLSAGISSGTDVDTLVRAADTDLYAAKTRRNATATTA